MCFLAFGEAHYHRTQCVDLIVAMVSIGRCVLDAPHLIILWGDITFSFVLRPPEHSLQTVMAYSSISATPTQVSTGLGALAGHPYSGPTVGLGEANRSSFLPPWKLMILRSNAISHHVRTHTKGQLQTRSFTLSFHVS